MPIFRRRCKDRARVSTPGGRPAREHAQAGPGLSSAPTWYDNSAANRSNPDPTAEVRWGEQTDEEMMFTAMSYLIDAEAEANTAQQP